jgi:hypothetical protein
VCGAQVTCTTLQKCWRIGAIAQNRPQLCCREGNQHAGLHQYGPGHLIGFGPSSYRLCKVKTAMFTLMTLLLVGHMKVQTCSLSIAQQSKATHN